MGALVVNPDKIPVPTQQIVQELKEIIPLLSAPYMVHRFHANRAMKETSDKVSAFQLEVSGRTEGSHKISHVLETLSNCSVLQTIGIQLRRDSLRHSPAAELVQKLMRLRLLNSSNTCYMNATIVAWLHTTNRLNCNDRQAYGSRMQAWRDITQSLRPLHVHTLASWRSILAGWRDLHRQQDASEFLEHWVAVGRPQAVVGTWEARIENHLIEIRHHSSTDVALNLDLEQSHIPQSLQHLIFTWHTQQLGIQALKSPPIILMIRLSRFRQVQNQMQKVTTPVIIEPRLNLPAFDDDTLQCTNVPYNVWSVILHAGHSPHAGHYTSRLPTATADGASGAQWSTDDARPAKLIMRAVMHDQNLSQQSYILLLGRGSTTHEQ